MYSSESLLTLASPSGYIRGHSQARAFLSDRFNPAQSCQPLTSTPHPTLGLAHTRHDHALSSPHLRTVQMLSVNTFFHFLLCVYLLISHLFVSRQSTQIILTEELEHEKVGVYYNAINPATNHPCCCGRAREIVGKPRSFNRPTSRVVFHDR